MALIPQEELPILKSAADVKTVAEGAKLEAETMAVAKLINTTANTGAYEALYNHPISDELWETLEGQGYKLRHPAKITCAEPETQVIISWRN